MDGILLKSGPPQLAPRGPSPNGIDSQQEASLGCQIDHGAIACPNLLEEGRESRHHSIVLRLQADT
jgi:hypothetical protein